MIVITRLLAISPSAVPSPPKGERVRVRGLRNRANDGIQNSFDIEQNFLILEAHDSITQIVQTVFAILVIFPVFLMRRSIYLYNQVTVGTKEIHYKTLDWILAPEFVAEERAIPQAAPELILCDCLAMA